MNISKEQLHGIIDILTDAIDILSDATLASDQETDVIQEETMINAETEESDKDAINQGTKRPAGRPRSRGTLDVDYKRISLCVPTEMYERIKDQCRGNMTQYIVDAIAAYLK